MEHLTSGTLNGIWCSIQIPFNQNDTIDFASLQTEINILTNSSLSGLYSNGTAGEFFNQTELEFDQISEMFASSCHQANIPFQIGASHMSPVISLERIKRTKALQPSAFQIIYPDWLTLNYDEQLSFLDGIIEAADPIPVVLYNAGHSKTVLNPCGFKKLSEEFPQLIGIKVVDGGPEWYKEMREMDLEVAVFTPGHRLATGIKEGVSTGSYSNIACLDPEAAQIWYDIILSDIDEGLRIETKVLEFLNKCILPFSKKGYSDAALDKFLWSLSGRDTTDTKLRWPYKGIDREYLGEIRKYGRKILPQFFNI
ncbi:dihydrodipicolinate synthase family protein [Membranihabitans maritimus]|uniref:dihydrodipicolinate synthase family protein n=1 Tax=Membranihabitans maritimus TaxID=2904244 RepID=UPI001F003E57|nr:dihydrodipicolinate synthase family protein [Membranihabitans maritimus]